MNSTNKEKEVDLGKLAQKASLRFILGVVFIATALIGGFMLAINQLNLSFIYVSGNSMSPDLEDGDIAIVKYEELIYPGQVVVFREPARWKEFSANSENSVDIENSADSESSENNTNSENRKENVNSFSVTTDGLNGSISRNYFVKNVVAVVGQELTINEEGVHVDGENVFDFDEKNYTCKAVEENKGKAFSGVLNNRQVFVMGTNYQNSLDSLRIFCDHDPESMFLTNMNVSQHGEIIKVL